MNVELTELIVLTLKNYGTFFTYLQDTQTLMN